MAVHISKGKLCLLFALLFSLNMLNAQYVVSDSSYAVRNAELVMARHKTKHGDWDNVTGTVLKAFQVLYKVTGAPSYYNDVFITVNSVVDAEGVNQTLCCFKIILGFFINDNE